MRPHTVAYIAILLHFLQNPDSDASKFYIELVIVGGTKEPTRRYDIRVLKHVDMNFQLKTSGMWSCTTTIEPRYAGTDNKVRITHDHNPQISEEITLHTSRVEGRYSGHATYNYFISRTNEPETLEFTSSANNLRYEVTDFSAQ